MSLSVNSFHKMYDRELITDYLPIIDFDEKHSIYMTNDGGFGIIYDCSPLVYTSENSINSLLSALQVLPPNAYIQVLLFASPNVTSIVDRWEFLKTRDDDLSKELTKTYKAFLEQKVKEDITPSYNAPLRNFKLILTIKIGGKDKESSLFGDMFKMSLKSLKNLSKIFNKEKTEEQVKEDRTIDNLEYRKKFLDLISVKSQLLGSLKNAGLNPDYMKPNELIKFFYEVMNQNHDFRDVPKWDGSDLSNFLFANDNKVEVFEKYIKCDEKYVKSLSVKEYPEEWFFPDVIKYTGDILTSQNLNTPFILSMNIKKLNDSEGKDKIFRSAAATNSQQMPYSMFPKLKFIHKDLNYGMDKLQKGAVPYYFAMQMIIFGDNEDDINTTTGRVKSYFKSLSFNLEEDNYVTLPVLLSVMPLGYDSVIQNFLDDKEEE